MQNEHFLIHPTKVSYCWGFKKYTSRRSPEGDSGQPVAAAKPAPVTSHLDGSHRRRRSAVVAACGGTQKGAARKLSDSLLPLSYPRVVLLKATRCNLQPLPNQPPPRPISTAIAATDDRRWWQPVAALKNVPLGSSLVPTFLYPPLSCANKTIIGLAPTILGLRWPELAAPRPDPVDSWLDLVLPSHPTLSRVRSAVVGRAPSSVGCCPSSCSL